MILPKEDFFANEDENMHTENAVELAKKFGTPEEIKRMEMIMTAHNTRGQFDAEQEERDELVRKYYPKLEGITEGEALTEEQFDEAAGKKDAYTKVKADTK